MSSYPVGCSTGSVAGWRRHRGYDPHYRNSIAVLGAIDSPPELAQSPLAYGRFLSKSNAEAGREHLKRALTLFENLDATGWIEEARIALSAISVPVIEHHSMQTDRPGARLPWRKRCGKLAHGRREDRRFGDSQGPRLGAALQCTSPRGRGGMNCAAKAPSLPVVRLPAWSSR
jgi:hypothetical protein